MTTAGNNHLFIDPYNIFAAGSSAAASRLSVHPLDTLRVRIQTWPSHQPIPRLSTLIPKPVLTNLYAGLPVALAFSIPALSVYLTTYDAAKKFYTSTLLPPNPSWTHQAPVFLLSGLTAEIVSGVVWTPMDVAKSRLQKGGQVTGNSAAALLRHVWLTEGPRGLWRGYWVSIAVFGPHVSLYWACYEGLKSLLIPGYSPSAISSSPPTKPKTSLAPMRVVEDPSSTGLAFRYAGCSAVAVSTSAMVTNPLEVVRTRWQTSGSRGQGVERMTVGSIIKETWQAGGWKGFMRGSGARVLYYIPSNAISMTVFEMLKRQRASWGW